MRTTTSTKRLNSMMAIHNLEDMSDRIDLCDVGRYIFWKENRYQAFYKFTKNDSLPRKRSMSKSTLL